MAPHDGSRDHDHSYIDPRAQVDPEAAWAKVDLFLIAFLILVPILGIIFGL